jgi:AraC-like DNA-binding protein
MSLVVETHDADSTLALLSSTRGVIRIRAHDHPAEVRLVHHRIGSAGIDDLTLAMNFDADVSPPDRLIFGQVSSGAIGFQVGAIERWYAQGDIYLAGQPRQRRITTVRAGQHEQAVLDPALPSEVADTGPGRLQQPVRFTGYEPVSSQAAQAWKNAYAYIRQVVLANPDTAEAPLIGTAACRLLVATALSTFPNNALADPTAEDRHDAHPGTLRRALAFIDDNAQTDITMAEIAAAAHVTIRAVQLAFRRHLGITPMEYLRRVRLDHAHHDLVTADPARDTVTAISYRWGFPSPSRFATSYRQAYGVTPSHTLRRS